MSSRTLIVFLALLALFFVGAMYHLLSMQYTSGHAYPPYSSYAAQPLGTGAFYEALESMPGLAVSRHIEAITRLDNGSATTLFLLGATTSDDPETAVAAIEHFVSTGGRLVVGFVPASGQPEVPDFLRTRPRRRRPELDEDTSEDGPPPHEESTDDSELDEEAEESKDSEKDERVEELRKRFADSAAGNLTSIADRWGFAFEYDKLTVGDEGVYEPVTVTRVAEGDRFPKEMSWRSALYFSALDDHWTTLYDHKERAVLIERPWGSGSIALASDSYLFTNEAMRSARSTELLAWFVGDNANVVFEESHLGIQNAQGIATLGRKYNLEGLVIAIIVTALLFVWKSLVSLVPKRKQSGPIIDHSDKDTLSGMSNLFRRNIAKSRILRTCLDEWEKAHAHNARIPSTTREEIRQLVESEERKPTGKQGPITTYKRICSILKERKHLT